MGKIIKWTEIENNLLYKIYPEYPTETVKSSFNRSWDGIKIQANKLKIKRNVMDIREGDISFLLLDNCVAYYWIGFIMSDGSINHKQLRLSIGLSIKDKNHLTKFADLIKTNIKEEDRNVYGKIFRYCKISIADRIKIKKLINKFDFKQNKTENPPTDILWMNDDLFLAFLTGFIDGDGCIQKVYKRKDSKLSIKNHHTWLSILNQFRIKLENIFKIKIHPAKINNKGYAILTLVNIKLLRLLKIKMLSLNIPYMERKWNLIDETLISRYEIADIRRAKIKELSNIGMRNKEICKKLNMSKTGVSLSLSKTKSNNYRNNFNI